MYGSLTDHPVDQSPDIQMHHLAAVVGIKIVNNTGGPIRIQDIEFGTPRLVSKDPITQQLTVTQEASPILGECTVAFDDKKVKVNTSTADGAKVSSTCKVTLQNPITLPLADGTNEMTVYVAVSPVQTKGKTISIKVNGSQRTLPMKTNVFESGKVTTFKVSVNQLAAPQVTNAVNTIKSQCRMNENGALETVTILPSFGTKLNSMTVNGQSVADLYKVSSGQTLTIQGFAKDMINAMPLSFNVSSCDNQNAAMTIHTINAWMPEYKSSWGKKDFSKLSERVPLNKMSVLKYDYLGIIKGILSDKGLGLSDGIQRSELLKFVDPNTITFNNLSVNGYFSNNNVVVLNEDSTNKSLGPGLIDTFLKNKFSLDSSKPATYIGLYAILNATYSDKQFSYSDYTYNNGNTVTTYTAAQMKTEAEQTATSIYNKVKSVLDNRGAGALIGLFADDATHLMHILRDVKVEIKIQPYPYAEYYDISDPTTGTNPLVLWGLNAGGITIN